MIKIVILLSPPMKQPGILIDFIYQIYNAQGNLFSEIIWFYYDFICDTQR